MAFDFKDNVATCNAIDHPPFAIGLCHTVRTVPASAVGVNAGISVHPVVAELENYEQWRSAQVALTHSDQTRNVHFAMFRALLLLMPVFLLLRHLLLRPRLRIFSITMYSVQMVLCQYTCTTHDLAMHESAALSCPLLCMVSGLVELAYCKCW